MRRMAQRSATHTVGWKANGAVAVLLLHSDPNDPDHSKIAMVCKYVLCYGRKGVERPKIHRQIWGDAVLRVDERCEEKALRAKLLNTSVARRMITKADCMVEAGNLPLWGIPGNFRQVSLSGLSRLQATGVTGATSLDMYRERPIEDGRLSLYEFVSRMGDAPVLTGEALRPHWPPSDAYARAMLLLHIPWRQASDIREYSSETWAPEFNLFLGLGPFSMALKVNVGRAKAVSRAGDRVWEDPTQAEVADPEDYDEEGPRIYAPPAIKARRKWAQIFPISNITETQETGHLSRTQWRRRVSPGLMPLRHGFQRERPMSAHPGVARGFRLGRAVRTQASTPTAPIRVSDFKLRLPSKLSRNGSMGAPITISSAC